MCVGIFVAIGTWVGVDDHISGTDPHFGNDQLYARNGTTSALDQPRWLGDVFGVVSVGVDTWSEPRGGRKDPRTTALRVALREVAIPIYYIYKECWRHAPSGAGAVAEGEPPKVCQNRRFCQEEFKIQDSKFKIGF